jgi:hypothetical protein
VTLRDEHSLRALANKALRGGKLQETGEKLYVEGLSWFVLTSSINELIQLRRISWAGHVTGVEDMENA